MVAKERHVPEDDRLLVIRIYDLIDILLVVTCFLYALLPLCLEWREHASQEILGRDIAYLILEAGELVVNLNFLGTAAMNRHLEHFHFNDFLVPLLVKLL